MLPQTRDLIAKIIGFSLFNLQFHQLSRSCTQRRAFSWPRRHRTDR